MRLKKAVYTTLVCSLGEESTVYNTGVFIKGGREAVYTTLIYSRKGRGVFIEGGKGRLINEVLGESFC